MLPTRQGSIRLFRFAGISLYLNWTWFLLALYGIEVRAPKYSSYLWPTLEYAALFCIVLMHEFGHALACRSVGGKADEIVLWPFGGVAYVAPPPRPGATLWSIAAGPAVNVMLAPILTLLWWVARSAGWDDSFPNAYAFVSAVCLMNYGLLAFNLLPIYPLDGGQIVQSLLWFVLGRARSLFVAAIIGFAGVAGLIALAVFAHSWWLGFLSVLILMSCWRGLMHARVLARLARLPRRPGYACPVCHQPAVMGAVWRCAKCLAVFDTFETRAVCPGCGTQFPVTRCLDCGAASPLDNWVVPPPLR
jgi:Zn-dependent protease